MSNLYSACPDEHDENKQSTNRLLKRLRIALFIWLIAFIVVLVWFFFNNLTGPASSHP